MIDKINTDLQNAMKEHNSFKLSVLRMLKSALQLESINKKQELSDSEIINVIKKQVKLRKDSATEYQKYGKTNNVLDLEREIAILNAYLPEEISQDEILEIINLVFSEVQPQGLKDMGNVMKQMNIKLAHKNADMALVSQLVKEKLSNI